MTTYIDSARTSRSSCSGSALCPQRIPSSASTRSPAMSFSSRPSRTMRSEVATPARTPVEIRTARFLLRELTERDATERYLKWLADPEVNRFIVTARATTELGELRAYVRARSGRDDVLFLGILDGATGQHVGNIKYEPLDSARGFARSEEHTSELQSQFHLVCRLLLE